MSLSTAARIALFSLLPLALIPLSPAEAAPEAAAQATAPHDFDFLVGDWHAQHRRLKERLAGSHEWIEFDGTLSNRPLMAGWGNEGDNVFNMPSGVVRGVGFRAYDAKTGLWSVWWLDSRYPADPMDPPARGKFENGIGIFISDSEFNGKPVRVRARWSDITPNSAHWEQAYSADGGKTWETNWTTDFKRQSP